MGTRRTRRQSRVKRRNQGGAKDRGGEHFRVEVRQRAQRISRQDVGKAKHGGAGQEADMAV